MCPADLDRGRLAAVTPPKTQYLARQPSRRPGHLLYFDLVQSSPNSVSLCRTRGRDSQRVTPFVIRLPGVSSDVYPSHLVVAGQLLELLPQIPIHHWLSSRGAPAVGLPPRKELR